MRQPVPDHVGRETRDGGRSARHSTTTTTTGSRWASVLLRVRMFCVSIWAWIQKLFAPVVEYHLERRSVQLISTIAEGGFAFIDLVCCVTRRDGLSTRLRPL